jgi:hypothetical protein
LNDHSLKFDPKKHVVFLVEIQYLWVYATAYSNCLRLLHHVPRKRIAAPFPHGAPTQSSFLPLRPYTPQGLKNWLCHALISLLQVDAVLVLMIPVAHVFKVANRNPCQAIR